MSFTSALEKKRKKKKFYKQELEVAKENIMEQHIAGFEKACRQACLLVPDADLSPMDVDKYD